MPHPSKSEPIDMQTDTEQARDTSRQSVRFVLQAEDASLSPELLQRLILFEMMLAFPLQRNT